MMKVRISTLALVLVFLAVGFAVAQSTSANPLSLSGMTGSGMAMMDGGMMGQGSMMSGGMMSMMMGQPLTQEQLEQFAKQHGITLEQAKQMTDACTQIMTQENKPETPNQ